MKKHSRQKYRFEDGLPVGPLLAPAAIIPTLMFLLPLLVFLRYSFNRFVTGGIMETAWTLENFGKFFSDSYYYSVLWRTLRIAFCSTLLTLILAFPVALSMSKTRGRAKSFFVIFLVFPMMLGTVTRSMGWMGFLGESGMLNRMLIDWGLIQEPLKMMYTEGAVIMAIIAIELPLMILTLASVFESMNPDWEHAALNLGANRIVAFFKVKLPLAVPGILAGTSLVFVQSMNTYSTARMVGGPRMQMMTTTIYTQVTEVANWPFGAAMALILLIITLAITYLYAHVLESKYIKAMRL